MGIKHIIFTLDDVSTKTFGDSTTLKKLKDSPELEAEEEEEEERAPKRVKSITSHVKTQLQRFREETETVPILIQQQKNKASFLAGFEQIFSSEMD